MRKSIKTRGDLETARKDRTLLQQLTYLLRHEGKDDSCALELTFVKPWLNAVEKAHCEKIQQQIRELD